MKRNRTEIDELKKEISKLNKKIEKLENKEEPKFEVGKWYKGVKRKNIIAYCERLYERGFYGYGFDDNGVWSANDLWLENADDPLEATKEEVEEALIKEAKRRGFKDGIKFVSSKSSLKGRINTSSFNYLEDCNELCCLDYSGQTDSIFHNGKWAEIIEGVTINGHEMKQEGDIVSFGCAKFHKVDLRYWERTLTEKLEPVGNRKIKSITLDSGVEITVEQLEEIVDNLK